MEAMLPLNENARLKALLDYRILDTLPEDSYDDITLLASEICATPMAALSLIDNSRQWFKSKVGLTVPETAREHAFCAHAILQPDIMIVNDAYQDSRFTDNPFVTGNPWIRFYAGAPLVTSRGEALGTLCVIDQDSRTLSDAQIKSLQALSRQAMALLELRKYVQQQKKYQKELREYQLKLEHLNTQYQKLSITDDVTGFNNTRFLHQYLDAYLKPVSEGGHPLSLVFFDMDNFKKVVDSHGHLLGAKVLKEVAETVNEHLESDDHIVRYGGDEFIVVLPGQGSDAALSKVQAIKKEISSQVYLKQESIDLNVTASFGIATYPQDAGNKKQLLMAADLCLFQSKKEGKNRISITKR
ncbi:MAG: sensor domain-containing diguanylate cyclase [Desulfobacterales bacterium]|nr:sensor domain-containing diguanylate cyclase [Desulfobacterales bacterium]MDX2513319.1 sensor domain-containing diguanylate cyclase [Desulfobacterales bacterium]